jgi:signal transduction histidine kinase
MNKKEPQPELIIAQLEHQLAQKIIELKDKNRDLEIGFSLEKIRERTMVMRHSTELREVVAVIYDQLKSVGFEYGACTIIIIDEESGNTQHWVEGFLQKIYPESYQVNYFNHPFYNKQLAQWKNGEKYAVLELSGESKHSYDDYMFTRTDFKNFPEEAKRWMTQLESVIFSIAYMKHGALTWGPGALSQQHSLILQSFARVFEQTYTRFLDLKKAEAQAREAQIEVALERIRAKALAMQTSNDLLDVANVLREQMGNLGQRELESSIVHLYNDDSENFEAWYAFRPPNLSSGEIITGVAIVPKNSSLWAREVVAKYKSVDTEYTIEASGQKLLEWYKVLEKAAPVTIGYDDTGQIITPEILYYHFSNFSGGSLLMISNAEPSVEARELQKRAANVFGLAFTRFNDLKRAEAQTHKALIETALERVRARALAMQEPEEIIEVARVLRLEMGLLGVEELEGSTIFIYTENKAEVECWFAIKDTHPEKHMVADYIALKLTDTWVGRQMLQFFDSEKIQISIPMKGDNRREWIEYCSVLSPSLKGFYGAHIPDRIYHLYKFSNGAIGAASSADLSKESWELLSRAASVFSLAYLRFKDLTQARTDLIQLKEEKKRSEDAFIELKATQSQLIQSEKMASLGELTAGIAHEIQNPLNFVNNFSEVNKEMIAEMKDEINKGNYNEVKIIADDIEANEEKINHHGKRADAIVKGMLQHSRSSTGQKEPTDINALADEYLRLTYHGLRAKAKSFIATIQTDFDESIQKINIVPQDIARVLLNLYNNAFYAVSEKKKQQSENYEPTVVVNTKKNDDKILICIKDNGTGIPGKALDKIFQPFFTTKPAGQGTGLGLSLSYDIIKAHGGEIKVETKEGEGAEFRIQLPVK